MTALGQRAAYGVGVFSEGDAQKLAEREHDADTIEHVRRVAEAAPEWCKVAAWLHDVVEDTAWTYEDLRRVGVAELEVQALRLLTRVPGDGRSYSAYVDAIATAEGEAGRQARAVKRSDLRDNLARSQATAMTDRVRRYSRALAVVDAAIAECDLDH